LTVGLLGGQWTPLKRLPPVVRAISGFVPTRWTFEALLLLETYQQPVTVSVPEPDAAAGRDVAEEYFPAESERMGVRADALALVTMLIGLAGAIAFISLSPRLDPSPTPVG
jgi:hypothetical protein